MPREITVTVPRLSGAIEFAIDVQREGKWVNFITDTIEGHTSSAYCRTYSTEGQPRIEDARIRWLGGVRQGLSMAWYGA